MYKLSFHADVDKDIEEIALLDSVAVARFYAFFAEVKNDPSLLQSNSVAIEESDSYISEKIDIGPWSSMRKSGRNLWRLRFSDFAYREPDYRIIYFTHETLKQIVIIAILKREDIDYDNPNDPIFRRIASAYDQYFR